MSTEVIVTIIAIILFLINDYKIQKLENRIEELEKAQTQKGERNAPLDG